MRGESSHLARGRSSLKNNPLNCPPTSVLLVRKLKFYTKNSLCIQGDSGVPLLRDQASMRYDYSSCKGRSVRLVGLRGMLQRDAPALCDQLSPSSKQLKLRVWGSRCRRGLCSQENANEDAWIAAAASDLAKFNQFLRSGERLNVVQAVWFWLGF